MLEGFWKGSGTTPAGSTAILQTRHETRYCCAAMYLCSLHPVSTLLLVATLPQKASVFSQLAITYLIFVSPHLTHSCLSTGSAFDREARCRA